MFKSKHTVGQFDTRVEKKILKLVLKLKRSLGVSYNLYAHSSLVCIWTNILDWSKAQSNYLQLKNHQKSARKCTSLDQCYQNCPSIICLSIHTEQHTHKHDLITKLIHSHSRKTFILFFLTFHPFQIERKIGGSKERKVRN